MKKLLITALATMSFSIAAQDKEVKYDDFTFTGDIEYYKFCKAAATDNTRILREAIRDKAAKYSHNILRRTIIKEAISEQRGVTCNDVDLLSFAQQNDSTEVYSYIRRKS